MPFTGAMMTPGLPHHRQLPGLPHHRVAAGACSFGCFRIGERVSRSRSVAEKPEPILARAPPRATVHEFARRTENQARAKEGDGNPSTLAAPQAAPEPVSMISTG
jgi:hypothetical protein